MALDALFRLEGEDALFVIGRDADGEPEGFLHFAVSQPGSALSLSSMPRLRQRRTDSTSGSSARPWSGPASHRYRTDLAELRAVCRAARARGRTPGSSGFSACAAAAQRAISSSTTSWLFNRKFFPRWQPRFVVYERRCYLPRVGVAALAAEAYLPSAAATAIALSPPASGSSSPSASAAALELEVLHPARGGLRAAAAVRPPAAAAPPSRSSRTLRWLAGSPHRARRLGALRRGARARPALARSGGAAGQDRSPRPARHGRGGVTARGASGPASPSRSCGLVLLGISLAGHSATGGTAPRAAGRPLIALASRRGARGGRWPPGSRASASPRASSTPPAMSGPRRPCAAARRSRSCVRSSPATGSRSPLSSSVSSAAARSRPPASRPSSPTRCRSPPASSSSTSTPGRCPRRRCGWSGVRRRRRGARRC